MATRIEDRPGEWWNEHRRCPICNPSMYTLCGQPLYHVPANSPLAECDVVTCASCGFTFSDTPTTQGEFDRYYAASTRYRPEVTSEKSWNADRYRITADRLDDLMPVPTPEILDVGCGAGGFVKAMKGFGLNAIGTKTLRGSRSSGAASRSATSWSTSATWCRRCGTSRPSRRLCTPRCRTRPAITSFASHRGSNSTASTLTTSPPSIYGDCSSGTGVL